MYSIICCVKEKKNTKRFMPLPFFFLSFHSFIFSFFLVRTWEVAIAIGVATSIPITIGT
jgi:hypothetical protein